jgi:hypothetical protein
MRYHLATRSIVATPALIPAIGLLALLTAWPPDVAGFEQAPPPGQDAFTSLVASALAPPQPVLGADDRIHLAYELFVTNPTPSTMAIEAVETLDPGDQNRVLARLDGAALSAASRPFAQDAGTSIGSGQVSRIFLDLTLEPSVPLPASLAHRFGITLAARDGDTTAATVVSGVTPVSRDAAVVLDPPLAGRRWLVGGGCCFPPTYHRTATLPVNGAFHAAQRFAIDFVQLDAEGQLFTGPREELQSYAYYGAPIYAVADGAVVGIENNVPQAVPGSFPPGLTAQTLLGNHAVVDIGGGRFAFYAHMQPGSVRVQVGDVVQRGQVLGLLGNSGNTDGPHLHFHVMDGPSPLGSNGLPFVFRSFDSEGTSTNDIDDLLAGQRAVIGPALAGPHQNQMPLLNEIVSFPAIRQ